MSAATLFEEPVEIACEGDRMWGVLARPPQCTTPSPLAVLIAVGGPQYRVGSHRQFVQLARALARAGHCCLRFDYRGMGDSEGDMRDFEGVEHDLRNGLDALMRSCPDARSAVVWGLCDAAAAALMYTTDDPRVTGIVAANPWARSEASLGAVRVKHYYLDRIRQREFWAKLLRGGLAWRESMRSLAANLQQARRSLGAAAVAPQDFQSRMALGLSRFPGRVLLIISGKDLTALEFLQYAGSAPSWKGLLARPGLSRVDIADADHTFSSRAWSEAVENATVDWLRTLAYAPANSK